MNGNEIQDARNNRLQQMADSAPDEPGRYRRFFFGFAAATSGAVSFS